MAIGDTHANTTAFFPPRRYSANSPTRKRMFDSATAAAGVPPNTLINSGYRGYQGVSGSV
jgi:hypothetical protein